jgi:hypothetical protein
VRYAFHDVTLESAIPLPEVRRGRARGSPGLVAIELARAPFDGRVDWFHRWLAPGAPGARRRRWLSFGRQPGGYVLRFHDLADFHVSPAGDRVRCLPIDGCPRLTLRHLLLDQVLPLVLSQRGSLVLHASAVHVDGFGTIAFAGAAGSGKSTLAAALAVGGCSLVSDDSLVIADGTTAPAAVPGYPGVRLWRDSARRLGLDRVRSAPIAHYTSKARVGVASLAFRRTPSPLRAIFVLGRRSGSGSARALPLGPRARLIALARLTFVMDVGNARQLSAMFTSLCTLVSRVPVARLHVPDGQRSPERTADEVLGLARRPAAS